MNISRFKLLDYELFSRRFIAYMISGIIAVATCACIVLLEVSLFNYLTLQAILITTIVLSILLTLIFRPLLKLIQNRIDVLFHNNDAIYNKLLSDFTSRTSNILELKKVSAELLTTLGETMHPVFVDLLLPDSNTGDYVSHSFYPQSRRVDGNTLKFSRNGSVVVWLTREGKPFDIKAMSKIPELKTIIDIEKSELNDPSLSLLMPIIRQDRLIGILAIGNRQGGKTYDEEQIKLITALARQAGIVIENAQLYALARERANIDELTGLYNHRYFHQRIDEEISRNSRFGDVFSLIIMDLDYFKSYNDVHGHLYGDKILRRVGEMIKRSIRDIDIAFRYGGDEFAIIMPQTSIEGASKLAERIRKLLEYDGRQEETLVTCTIGVASWPTDGVSP